MDSRMQFMVHFHKNAVHVHNFTVRIRPLAGFKCVRDVLGNKYVATY